MQCCVICTSNNLGENVQKFANDVVVCKLH